MSSPAAVASNPSPVALDAKWRQLPVILMGGGAAIAVIGAFINTKQFAFSYLMAFMFFLSIVLGALFLTIIHHLFDANWSVPIRRINEHLAFLAPVMAALFIPIAVLAPKYLYDWMQNSPETDHALHAKQPIFTLAGFYFIAVAVFAIWTWISWNLRKNSIAQDATGAAIHTRKMRVHSAYGIYAFAFTLTLAVIMWVKALEHQWFSTMLGVYYFAESVWVTLATVYIITAVLKRTGPLSAVVQRQTFYDIGVLLFAFTVFYAYIHFSQYFLIWNAAMPEETFWYVQREKGSWWDLGMVILFGHFLVPFLSLLRIDAKLHLPVMVPLCGWIWLMHYCDMSYNIMPVLHPSGFHPHLLDFACLAFIGGVLAFVWLKYFNAHAPYPLKDPRLGETLGVHRAPPDEHDAH